MSTIDSTFERLDSLSVLIERIHRHAQGIPHDRHPGELSQRELVATTAAALALIDALTDAAEPAIEGAS